ncbi:N-acetyltransferase [Clostridium sp. Marseille-QA1073]
MDSSFGKVAVKDGTVVGIILGHAKGDKKCYGFLRHIFKIAFQSFSILFHPKKDRQCVIEYLKLFKTYKELMKNREHLFAGNIVLLALSKECRGLGVEKALMYNLFEYFKSKSEKSIYVYTDTACNYGFYDHIGFNPIDFKEVTINLKPATIKETVFLYQYQF